MIHDNRAFQQIVLAAKAQDPALLPAGISIDIRKGDVCNLTPAGTLARQNDREAVEFLLTQGANISYVALGAAIGGHEAFTESLI